MDLTHKSLGIIAVIFAMAVGNAHGKPEIKFLKLVELPGLNLSLKIMPASQESPPPPPSVYTYNMKSDGMDKKCEMFLPVDLWRHSQTASRWIDKFSNTLTLATMTRPLIKGFPREHVMRDEYDKKLAGISDPPPWTDEALAQWVADFIGLDSVPGKRLLNCPPRLTNLIEFETKGKAADYLVYAFRLNPNAPGQFGASVTWFCAILRLNAGMDAEKARAAMAADFFKSLTISGKPRIAKPAVPGVARGKTDGAVTNQSPEFLASRQQVAESIQNMKNWWFAETRHYIILSNMKSRNSSLLKYLLVNIETLRAAFEQFVPPRVEISSVSVIRMFATSGEYLQYVGKGKEWTAGCWMSDKKELVIRPAEFGDKAEEKDVVLRTVYHEAFHQYIFYALDRISSSPWFNEGHAEFYETIKISPDRIDVSENADQLRVIITMIEAGQFNIKKLLDMSYDKFYSGDKETVRAHYAMAWALIYYLRKAAIPGQSFPYSEINNAYCDALVQVKDADQATAKAFENVDVTQFQADFIAFWESSTRRTQAERNRIFKSFVPAKPR